MCWRIYLREFLQWQYCYRQSSIYTVAMLIAFSSYIFIITSSRFLANVYIRYGMAEDCVGEVYGVRSRDRVLLSSFFMFCPHLLILHGPWITFSMSWGVFSWWFAWIPSWQGVVARYEEVSWYNSRGESWYCTNLLYRIAYIVYIISISSTVFQWLEQVSKPWYRASVEFGTGSINSKEIIIMTRHS